MNQAICSKCNEPTTLMVDIWREAHPYGSTVAIEETVSNITTGCCNSEEFTDEDTGQTLHDLPWGVDYYKYEHEEGYL